MRLGEPCPDCKGDMGNVTCPHCRGWGERVHVGCPLKIVDQLAWDVITEARLIEKGGPWPVTGGTLEQSRSFRDAVRFVWSEEAAIRAEQKGK